MASLASFVVAALKERVGSQLGNERTRVKVHVLRTDWSAAQIALFPRLSATQRCRRLFLLVSKAGGVLAAMTSYEYIFDHRGSAVDAPPMASLVYIDRVDSTANTVGLCACAVKAYILYALQCNVLSLPLQLHVSAHVAPVYLFPYSDSNPAKTALLDHQLIAWWMRILDRVVSELTTTPARQLSPFCWFTGEAAVPRSLAKKCSTHWKFAYPADKSTIAGNTVPILPDDNKGRLLQEVGSALIDTYTTGELLEVWDTLASSKAIQTALFILRIESDTSNTGSEIITDSPSTCSHSDFVQLINTLMKLRFDVTSVKDSSKIILQFLAPLENAQEVPLVMLTSTTNTCASIQPHQPLRIGKRDSENILDDKPDIKVNDLSSFIKKKPKIG